jgi:hypothetical protein
MGRFIAPQLVSGIVPQYAAWDVEEQIVTGYVAFCTTSVALSGCPHAARFFSGPSCVDDAHAFVHAMRQLYGAYISALTALES